MNPFNPPKLWQSILLLAAGMALGLLVPALFLLPLGVIFEIDQAAVTRIALLVGEALLPVPILIWAILRKYRLKEVFRFRAVRWNYICYTLMAGVGLLFVLDEIERLMAMFITLPDYMQELEALLRISDLPSALLLIMSIAVIGPLTEEMVFRGFFLHALEKNLKNATRAVVYTAVAFMISHFNIYWALSIFAAGFLLSFAGWKTKSIWPSFLFHLVNNSLSLAFTHFEKSIDPLLSFHGHTHPIVFLTGIFLLLYFMRKLTRLKTYES
ncbi:MAG: CPBP family intramembrane metalloprotease [Candidatus Marinimicrobia bacterium]|nr:CPBP family intramembrane metalloprotease [Candidatus Neomarinimicrobiota bacterium]